MAETGLRSVDEAVGPAAVDQNLFGRNLDPSAAQAAPDNERAGWPSCLRIAQIFIFSRLAAGELPSPISAASVIRSRPHRLWDRLAPRVGICVA
jgi:hypothetical protein